MNKLNKSFGYGLTALIFNGIDIVFYEWLHPTFMVIGMCFLILCIITSDKNEGD